jgi:hypothetical protein
VILIVHHRTSAIPFHLISDCSSPHISLVPNGSSPLSPLQFRRNQNIWITSSIRLQCSQSLAIVTHWSIHLCTASCRQWLPLNGSIVEQASELYIPSRTLQLGLYQLSLTVSMRDYPQLNASASVYVHITSAGIQVNLLPYGTSLITLGHDQNLTVEPGRFSVDLDAAVWNAEVRLV